MNFDRAFKYSVIVGIPLFFVWQGFIDESALGLEHQDLRKVGGLLFVLYFLVGTPIFILSFYLPYALVGFGIIALWLWWSRGRKWTTRTAAFATAGAVAALTLMTGVGPPLRLSVAAFIFVGVAARIKGRRNAHWVDSLLKLEVIFLTLAAIWLLSAVNLHKGYLGDQTEAANDEVPPYTTRYARQMNDRAEKVASRFSSPQACLPSESDASKQARLYAIDWDRIQTTTEAEVCMFRLLSALGGIEEFTGFMEAQGFRISLDSFSPENPFVESRDSALRATASWSVRENGPKYPTRGLLRRVIASIPYGMSTNVWYSPDGSKVLGVRITHSTL